jgi:hypothetical protein
MADGQDQLGAPPQPAAEGLGAAQSDPPPTAAKE